MADVTDPALECTVDWLRSAAMDPVETGWVPGATEPERRALRALASIAAHVMAVAAPPDWPEDILGWLDSRETLPPSVEAEVEHAIVGSPDEALAHLYSRIVAGPRRRVLGTFFTPTGEVAPMLEMWSSTEESPTTVVDVGAGVGVFTAAAARSWGQAKVISVDVNPVTLGLLGARVALPDMADHAKQVQLVLEDVTTWLPSDERLPDERRLILGNPPYTRGQLIDPQVRMRLVEATKGLCGSRASLSAFITAVSLRHLGPDDGLCLLLPAQWLESHYASGLRQYLLDLDNRRVELRLAESKLFDDAVVDAVILLVGTERDAPQPFLATGWAGEVLKTIERPEVGVAGWRGWFGGTESRTKLALEDGWKKLSDLAVLRRGTATGANGFFCLSDDLVAEHQLPTSVLRPLVRRLSLLGDDASCEAFDQLEPSERRWLLVVDSEAAALGPVAAYLKLGQEQEIDQRHLCRIRAGDWFDLTHDLFVPDVFVTSMTRGRVRVVSNSIGAVFTNNLYGWKWRPDVSPETRVAVLDWLRSDPGQAGVMHLSRSQGQGLSKVEPRSMAGLRLPGSLFSSLDG